METMEERRFAEDMAHLIYLHVQFGMRGETDLKLPEMQRLEARGWIAECEENGEYDISDAGRELIDARLSIDPAQEKAEPVAWGVVVVGDECDGELVDHAGTQADAEAIVRDWPVNDNATLRVAPLYTAPPAKRVRVPDGWMLVPIQSTAAMHDAFHAVRKEAHRLGEPPLITHIWQAMLSAAPEVSSQDAAASDAEDARLFRAMFPDQAGRKIARETLAAALSQEADHG